MRAWLADSRRSVRLAAREAARGDDARRRADVPRALGVDDRRRRRPEHDDPQQLPAEHGLRHGTRAGEAGARDPRGEHGRRQEAVAPVLPLRPRQDGHRRVHAHATRRSRASCARRRRTSRRSPGPARTAPSRRACSPSRSRPRRRSPRSSPRPARTSAWSGRARWRTAPAGASRAASTARSASPGSRSERSAAARRCRRRATGSALMGCAGPGQGLPLRADRRRGRARARDLGLGRDGDRRLGELLPRAPRARRRFAEPGSRDQGRTRDPGDTSTRRSRRLLRIVAVGTVLIALLIAIKDQRRAPACPSRRLLLDGRAAPRTGANGASASPASSPAGPGSS